MPAMSIFPKQSETQRAQRFLSVFFCVLCVLCVGCRCWENRFAGMARSYPNP